LRRAQNIRFWLVRTVGSYLAWLALVHPSQPSTAIQVLIRRRSRCGHGLPMYYWAGDRCRPGVLPHLLDVAGDADVGFPAPPAWHCRGPGQRWGPL